MLHKVGEDDTKHNKPIKHWLLDAAEVIDAFRIIPRILLFACGWLSYDIFQWFMTIPEPTTAHSIMITGISGLVTAVTGLYMNTPKK